MGRRPALIFDFGNVIAHFDFSIAGARLGEPLGMAGSAFIEHVRALGLAQVLRKLESGQITGEVFSRAVLDMAGLDLSHEQFVAAWVDIFSLNEPVARLIRGLKAKGYPLVLGSNTNDLHFTFFREKFAEALSPFDRLVVSFEVGHVKPAREFYLACAEAAEVPHGDCVFIDDMEENVEGARAAGLGAVHYRDLPSLRADLLALGVELPDDHQESWAAR